MCTKKINVYIASDHAGYDFKKKLLKDSFNTWDAEGISIINGSQTNRLIDLPAKYIDFNDSFSNHSFVLCDLGPLSDESCNYPEFAKKVVEEITSDLGSIGFLICGSGQGMAMAANKNEHIRCALCRTTEDVEQSVKHNHANIVSVGSRVSSYEDIKDILLTFVMSKTPFPLDDRHLKRVQMFSKTN